jgi:hypothetical protein
MQQPIDLVHRRRIMFLRLFGVRFHMVHDIGPRKAGGEDVEIFKCGRELPGNAKEKY